VIAFASWPLYRRLLVAVGGNRTIGATLAILFILTFLVVPIALAGTYAINELREWVTWAIETNRHGAVTPGWIATMPVIGEWLNGQWTSYLGHPGGIGEVIQAVSGSNIGNIYRGALAAGGSAFSLLLMLLFMMIALFFAYRDGESFAAQVDRLGERILPTRWERISRVVPATISSTVTGMTIIAIGEGLVLGIAYWLAGVPSPVTLG
ncbi:MAG: AI-2E family transporter, partial [Mesorhizobium sp.]